MSSCSKDNDDEDYDDSDIVGTWVTQFYDDEDEEVIYTICFKRNGTGWMEWSDEDDHYVFEYTTRNGKIYFEDEDEDFSWSCEYTLKGNKLTIYGNPWGEDDIDYMVLTRK